MRNKGIVCVYFKVINLNYGEKGGKGVSLLLNVASIIHGGEVG